MKIQTLDDLLKAADRRSNLRALSPQHARALVYEAMGHYIIAATLYAHSDAGSAEQVEQEMGALIHVLAIDAKTTLTPEKFDLLKGYPLTEEMDLPAPSKETLQESLHHTWGEEDIFIRRLSGGLFGSYMKALSALKPQVRAMGHDLSYAAESYIKSI